MELTLEQFTKLKKDYLEMVVEGTVDAGGLPPHITLFGYELTDPDKRAIIHVPITDDLMSTKGKELLFKEVIPSLAKKVVEKFSIYALAWSSEAWIREADKNEKIENWQDIPIKKEVVIVNFESTVQNECIIYEIKRVGQRVSDNGDLIDNIKLEPYESAPPMTGGGNLVGLLKNFRKEEN